jgi:hypothetical protein
MDDYGKPCSALTCFMIPSSWNSIQAQSFQNISGRLVELVLYSLKVAANHYVTCIGVLVDLK